jgi:hypothetical protein
VPALARHRGQVLRLERAQDQPLVLGLGLALALEPHHRLVQVQFLVEAPMPGLVQDRA